MPDHSLPRRRDPRAQAAILEATKALLLEVGYTALTIEGVAAKAGVGKSTIYRWWRSKGALAIEAVATEVAVDRLAPTGDARTDLAAAVDQLSGLLLHPLAGVVLFAVVAHLDDDPLLSEAFDAEWVVPWRRSARAFLESGGLPEGTDLEFLLDVLVGTTLQRALVVPEPRVEGLGIALADLVLGG